MSSVIISQTDLYGVGGALLFCVGLYGLAAGPTYSTRCWRSTS